MQEKQLHQDALAQENQPLNERMYPLIVDIAIMLALPDTGYDSSMLESVIVELRDKSCVSERIRTQYSIVLEGGDYHLLNWKLAVAEFDAMLADSTLSAFQHEQLHQCIRLLRPYTDNQLIKKPHDQLVELEKRALAIDKQKENRTIIKSFIVLSVIALVIASPFIYKNHIVPELAYREATAAIHRHEFGYAIKTLLSIPEYRDSTQLAYEAYYLWGNDLADAKDFEAALIAYTRANGHADAEERILECHYLWAEHAMSSGDYMKAVEEYVQASETYEVTARVAEAWYKQSVVYLDKHEYALAASAYYCSSSLFELSDAQKESYYAGGKTLLAQKKYDDAYLVFSIIAEYKDVASIIVQNSQLQLRDQQHSFSLGCIVKFGTYKEQIDETEPTASLEWVVVEQSGTEAVLVCRDFVAYKPIEAKHPNENPISDTSWDTSALRSWLNSEFIDNTFSSDEAEALIYTTVTPYRLGGTSKGIIGEATNDRVYLLSAKEWYAYESILSSTMTKSNRSWWLRSVEPVTVNKRNNFYNYIDSKGVVHFRGSPDEYKGIRPVIRVNITLDVFQFE